MLARPALTAVRSLTFMAALAASTSLAQAAGGKALFEKMLQGKDGRNTVTFGTVTENGPNSFAAQDVTVTNAKDGRTLKIGAVSAQNLTEDGDTVTVDALAMQDLATTTAPQGDPVRIGTFALSQARLPNPVAIGDDRERLGKQRVVMGSLAISGLDVASAAGGNVAVEQIVMSGVDVPLRYSYDEPRAQDLAAPARVAAVSVTGVTTSNQQGAFSLGKFSLTGLNIPTGFSGNMTDWLRAYQNVNLSGIEVKLGGKTVLRLGEMNSDLESENGVSRSRSTIDAIDIDLKAIPNPQLTQMANLFGYERVTGSMVGEGSYDLSSGRAAVDQLSVKLKDMFDVNIDYALQGYTQEVAQAMQEAQAAMAKGMSPMEAFGPVMDKVSQVKLERLGLSLTDRSLLGKVLDFQAQQMGTTGEQLAQGAPMMLGMGMAQLNMPEFTEMVTNAVGKFLRDKGTLSVEAVPAEPVPVVSVVAAGQADPTKVPQLLNLQVQAR